VDRLKPAFSLMWVDEHGVALRRYDVASPSGRASSIEIVKKRDQY
jgi:hypothetical protein